MPIFRDTQPAKVASASSYPQSSSSSTNEPGPFCCKVSCEHVPYDTHIKRSYVYGANVLQFAVLLEIFLAWADGSAFGSDELETGHVIEVCAHDTSGDNSCFRTSTGKFRDSPQINSGMKEKAYTVKEAGRISGIALAEESPSGTAKRSNIMAAFRWPRNRPTQKLQYWYTVFESEPKYDEIPETVLIRRGQLNQLCSLLLHCTVHQKLFEVNLLGGSIEEARPPNDREENMTKRDFVKAFRVLYEYIEKRRKGDNAGTDEARRKKPLPNAAAAAAGTSSATNPNPESRERIICDRLTSAFHSDSEEQRNKSPNLRCENFAPRKRHTD